MRTKHSATYRARRKRMRDARKRRAIERRLDAFGLQFKSALIRKAAAEGLTPPVKEY